ncbi:MAG: nucleotidyltransferase [Bacteroidetes bacterium GWC2_33_15]|nr:MAG: nucleotidyltransferase [Bacteroidetes bacterium GWA2_33_15]OFX50649.1 MAG: nucleotidyltransferase [Bacteroidetes bacterium GWC2_33_15]OFX63255.1 MAG: nucleotidyltransferase [Bacteroidetes bacterium GWB2_32_14]OFX69798.1 MAG: nucleotidyltransferase [Bacteroidetes bacterium GWD2_33_33]HAN19839.1 nucleotidyltransferase [Bacteroidales bacterium]
MNLTLLVLAAGMGSRYGGLKQLDQVGPSGETIIDYSVYDAIEAGFNKIVFIIRKDIEKDMKEFLFAKYSKKVKIEYVFQELDKLPDGIVPPEGRIKPWGTGHAVLMAKNVIHEPFVVINADDFYGKSAFKVVADYMKSQQNNLTGKYCMAGYLLKNTLSEHGVVSRGVCTVNPKMQMVDIIERTKIGWKYDVIVADDNGKDLVLSGNEYVSMNFWGFTPDVFPALEEEFTRFIKTNIDNLKSEYYIPSIVSHQVNTGKANVQVLEAKDQWFGVTYIEDKPIVIDKIKDLTVNGKYPEKLWK